MGTKIVRKTKTHFEQVPVAVVEKLLEQDAIDMMKKKPIADPKIAIERPTVKTEPYSVRSAV